MIKYLIVLLFLCTNVFSSKNYIININKSRIESRNTKKFRVHKDGLAMNITHSEIVSARIQIERALDITLDFFKGWKPILGEAHVTVITPPEFEKIKKFISITEINNIARKAKIQESDIKLLGIGSGKKEKAQTFFIIVQSSNLGKIRDSIASIVYKRSKSQTLFDSKWFFPHITIGFIEKDLHEQDGIIKSLIKSYDKRFILK